LSHFASIIRTKANIFGKLYLGLLDESFLFWTTSRLELIKGTGFWFC